MKINKISFICYFVVILIVLVFYLFNHDSNKIYLSNKYYNDGNFIKVKSDDLNNLENENYILFTYNNYCNMSKPCEDIFKEFMEKYKINFLSMPFDEFKKNDFYKKVKYAPSVIIVKKGKIVAYLDANSDDDLVKYQDVNEFEKWLDNYVYFSKNSK